MSTIINGKDAYLVKIVWDACKTRRKAETKYVAVRDRHHYPLRWEGKVELPTGDRVWVYCSRWVSQGFHRGHVCAEVNEKSSTIKRVLRLLEQ